MKLLYAEEHCACFNYERERGGAIEIKSMKPGDVSNLVSKYHEIIFVLKGQMLFDLENISKKEISEGQMLLYPSDAKLDMQALSETEIIMVRLPVTEQLCDVYSFEKLLFEGVNQPEREGEVSDLYINKRMNDYLQLLKAYITEGLRCTYFFQIKIKEMLFIFRAYYSKDELLRFFYPLLTSDMSFSEFILRNKHKVRTVKEFAELSNYSLSGFQKRFKKVFAVSAHKWLNEHRSKSILHEINSSEKTLKEISNTYGFSSQSYFNDFCKTNFGLTPGQLRSQKRSSTEY